MILSGWGRFPRTECRLFRLGSRHEAVERLTSTANSAIPRGNGRSYGDAALNPWMTLSTLGLNRLIDFDIESGWLTCEAGTTLADIVEVFLPRGWFLTVTPGTRFVTVGGAIAADVHGKNHHRVGCFGNHVESLELLLADGQVVNCSAVENAELFAATCGGMGLTGMILTARIRLQPVKTAMVRQETLRARDLHEVMAQFEESHRWTYTVAWIDCFASGASRGRSLLYRGEHAEIEELPKEQRLSPLRIPSKRALRFPIDLPGFCVNGLTIRAFNEVYYRRGHPSTSVVDYETFFYPLDAILEWNRAYGRNGFVQYQCVFPKDVSEAGLLRLLSVISAAGLGSFLAVLKLFGAQDGILSFPMAGYTLALDFPVNAATFQLLPQLDVIVADHGGRIYLAKDARMPARLMRIGYPALNHFRGVREQYDPKCRFRSLLSDRLDL